MKTENEKLYIVIPAYNERDNIYQVLDDWYPVVEKHSGGGESRLVVIDDGSKDDTYAIMQEYAKTHPLFEPLTKPNGGHGATVLYGYHYALEHGADYIFQTDSDGQTLPEEFEPFWKQKESYANTPFRLMKATTLQKYIGLIPKDFNLSNVILSVIYAKKGCKVKYIPITFRPRQGGVNSINMKKIFGIGRQAVRDFRKIAITEGDVECILSKLLRTE